MRTLQYEKLAEASPEEIKNAWRDERGVAYSADRKRLLKAPDELEGEYTVLPGTEVICNFAFCRDDGKDLTKVILPEGLKCIGDEAFSWNKLEGIDIPDSVECIGEHAFQFCSSLGWVKMGISSHLISIEDCAFQECTSLKEVYVPDSVVAIRDCAFAECTSLVKVRLGKNWNVRSGGGRTFVGCASLAEFVVAEENKEVCSKAGVIYSKDMTELIKCPPALPITSFEVPNTVTNIWGNVFRDCISLTGVTIPASVRSIGPSAFYGCKALKSIDIPKSVTSIGKRAFYKCESLQTINIQGTPKIGEAAFEGCPGYKEYK